MLLFPAICKKIENICELFYYSKVINNFGLIEI